MFKLVAVGGKLRGKEIILSEGENTIGRSSECDHALPVEGVSKRHLRVTVNADTAYAEDMGSSNGTIVNGKIIKKVTLKDGDKIALPNVIFQVVYVTEKKVIVKKKIMKADEDARDYDEQTEPPPAHILGKIIWMFKHRAMPIVYNFNEQYEWSALLGILLFAFVAVNVTLTILPVLRDSKVLLIKEIALRGKQYAAEVDRLNNVAIRDKNLDGIQTNFLDGEEGITDYQLFDMEGRIYRPVNKLNAIVSDSFSVDALRHFKNEQNQDKDVVGSLENNVIGIARPIKAHDRNLGRDVVVAVITISFSPSSLAREASNNSKAYLESIITASIVAILFFGILYYMTIKPLEEMKIQVERVLRGKQKELDSKTLFREIKPLRNTVNSILSRIKELQNTDSGEVQELEDDSSYIRTLQEFMAGAGVPVLILNSEKIIQNINPEGEDLLGLRENSASGSSLLDTARDQGLAATIIDLCDKSANNDGYNSKDSYEIGGKEMRVNVSALIGKDKFAKAFYVTFVRND